MTKRPEFHIVQGRAAVEVFSVPVDVICPGFQVIIAIGIERATVYIGFYFGKLKQRVVIIDVARHIGKAQGRQVQPFHVEVAPGFRLVQWSRSVEGQCHLVVDIIAKTQKRDPR